MTIEELKVVISAKTEKLQEGINKATNRLKDFKKSSNDTSSAMGGSVKEMQKKLESLNSSFEKTQEKILGIKEELGRLDAARDEIIDSYKDFPAFSGMTKDESLEQMLKSDSSFQKLSEEIDRLQTRMQPLIDKNNQTKKEMGELGEAINNAGKRAENAGNKFNEAGEKVRRLGIRSRLAGKHIFEAGNKVTRLAHVIDMSLKRVLRRIFIYAVMYKAIRGMIDYLNAALKTNKEFVRSLNVIRTNLRVAFQPIYEFVLPALNALMRGMATVTTYIASAVSALFGKTYKQSHNAAKGLEKTKKNMAGVGGAAKKAGKEIKGALAPFDELNTLNLDKGSDDSGGGGGAGDFEMLPMDQIDTSGLDEFKEKLATIFEPFKKAWENEGQATIDAIKYAFGEIKELIKAIGRSWVEVWTNGTGQAILETTLRILQNIFNTIGDMAQSFTKAWEEAGLGTSIMQHIHNIIQHILTLAERLTGAFREVWGEVGDKLAKIFLETLNNILATLDHLGEKLVWVWDNGGEHLFKGFVRLGAKIAELVMFILNEFVLPFVNWFIDLMAPAVAKLCDWTGNLLDKFVELIDWLMGDGYPVLETIVTVLGSLAIAFGVVKAAIAAKTVVLNIYKTAMSAAFIMGESFKGGLVAFLGPAGIAVVAIGGVIAASTLMYKHFSKEVIPEVQLFGKETSEATKKAVGGFLDLNDQATVALNQLSWSGQTVTKEIADNISGNFLQMTQQVQSGLDKHHKESLSKMQNFVDGSTNLSKEEQEEILRNMQEGYEVKKREVAESEARIKEILNTASQEKRELTRREQEKINSIQREMVETGVQVLSESEVESKAIMERMKAQAGEISAKQAVEVVQNSLEQKDKAIQAAEEQYNDVIKEIIRQRDEAGTLSEEQADKLIQEATRQREEAISKATDMHNKVVEQAKSQAGEHVNQVNWETGEVKTKWQVMKEDVIKKAKDIRDGVKDKWNEMWQSIKDMKNALVDAMMSPFKIADKQIHGVIGDARNWGRNLIQNFIDGINAMIGKVKNAVTKVADTVADRLGFHSPAKKGPGKDADKWMPNLMDMMAEGIENNVYKIEGSVDMTARTLQGMKSTNNVDSIASALAGAIGANNNNGGDMTVVVKIGEDTITEKVISNINRQSRISGKTVIQV